jgi:uncharacterized iron-regulated protein
LQTEKINPSSFLSDYIGFNDSYISGVSIMIKKCFCFSLLVCLLLILINNNYAQNGINSHENSDEKNFPYENYVQYLKDYGKKPAVFIIEKLMQYNLVMIGEDHLLKDHPQFISDLLKAIDKDESVELDYLAIEFGNAADQHLADEFVLSDTYHEEKAIQILQNGPDFCGWPYQEVLNIFKTVWELNHSQSKRKHIRILLTNSPHVIRVRDGEMYDCLIEQDKEFFTDRISRDRYMAHILEKKVIAHDLKAIYYCGGAHSSYLTRSYAFDEKTGNCLRYLSAGQILKILYPQLVYSVELYGANKDRAYYPSTNPELWDRYLDGKMDEIFRRNGNRPVGFDITVPPFSNIREGDYYMFWERGKSEIFKKEYPKCFEKIRDIANRIISDSNDGIIFLKPLEKYEGATVSEIFFDDTFMQRISKRAGETITKKDLYEYLLKIRPILGKSLQKLLELEE